MLVFVNRVSNWYLKVHFIAVLQGYPIPSPQSAHRGERSIVR